MLKYVNQRYRRSAPRHMWFGVLVEKPEYAFRIQHLRETNCAVRFLSCEPLVEALRNLNLDRIDQVIVGGECARQPRVMKEEWAPGHPRSMSAGECGVLLQAVGRAFARWTALGRARMVGGSADK
jgi:protein gp37